LNNFVAHTLEKERPCVGVMRDAFTPLIIAATHIITEKTK
jgi:hypothetical protein